MKYWDNGYKCRKKIFKTQHLLTFYEIYYNIYFQAFNGHFSKTIKHQKTSNLKYHEFQKYLNIGEEK